MNPWHVVAVLTGMLIIALCVLRKRSVRRLCRLEIFFADGGTREFLLRSDGVSEAVKKFLEIGHSRFIDEIRLWKNPYYIGVTGSVGYQLWWRNEEQVWISKASDIFFVMRVLNFFPKKHPDSSRAPFRAFADFIGVHPEGLISWIVEDNMLESWKRKMDGLTEFAQCACNSYFGADAARRYLAEPNAALNGARPLDIFGDKALEKALRQDFNKRCFAKVEGRLRLRNVEMDED